MDSFKTECVYRSSKDSHGNFVWKTDCGMHLQPFNKSDPEWNQAQHTREPVCYLCNVFVEYKYEK